MPWQKIILSDWIKYIFIKYMIVWVDPAVRFMRMKHPVCIVKSYIKHI